MDLFLVRHGQTEWSASGRHTGRTDVPLTALGRRQASGLQPVLRRQLDGRRLARIVSSPRSRAVETASLLVGNADVTLDSRAREFDYGDYEGLTRLKIHERDAQWTVWDRPCPRGETMEAVEARADSLLADLEGHEPTLVVAHGHFCRILAARALGLPGSSGRLFASSTGSLSVVRDHSGERCVVAWNLTAADGAHADGSVA